MCSQCSYPFEFPLIVIINYLLAMHQAGHWTLDNASNNGSFLTSLQEIYSRRQPDIVFSAEDSRIACFPHVINICVQHTLKALNDVNDDDEEGEEDDEDDSTIQNRNVPADLLGKIRSLVKAIRASGQRQASFDQVVLSGNDAGWWKDENGEPIAIKPLRFLRDVRTRWDSTYQMLVRILMFKQVKSLILALVSLANINKPLDQFLSLGSSIDIAKFRLSAAEWVRVTDIIGVLQVHLESLIDVVSE